VSVIGPMREAGGTIHARSVTVGLPFASSVDTSASPTASSVMARPISRVGFGRRVSAAVFTGFLVARRERAQRVLDTVPELAEHGVGHVRRALRDEIDPHALGSDEPHDLLDLLDQRRRRVREQQVRLVEEEHERRLVRIADFGQTLEQLDSIQSRNVA
jgi:hypothetical protein